MTTTFPQVLAPMSFPLSGSRLIEASAGTGKTFTIAALYLRLVLGHGGEQAYARALTPPEILVVTFTDAATKELRDRIRARLAQAAAYFYAGLENQNDVSGIADPDFDTGFDADSEPDFDPDADAGFDTGVADRMTAGVVEADAFLSDLRADFAPGQWADCARKLQLAAEWMDEAAVSTIHGWCHRMLREHAFDSDSLFTQTLETDQTELLDEVVRDYWRNCFYPLAAPDVATVQSWWATPSALLAELRGLLSQTAYLAAGVAPAQALAQSREEKAEVLAALKAPWPEWVEALREMLDAAVAAKVVEARRIHARYYGPWLDKLAAWAATPHETETGLSPAALHRLSPEGLAEAWKPGVDVPRHAALDALGLLPEQLASLPDARDDVLCHAVHWVAARFALEQQRRAQMGFDELLTRLDDALQGTNGPRLAELIRQQFPVALIDEFQDTDPLQYRIFDAIYQVAQNAPGQALILIGDPKQAIYAFRGADIYTYLSARRDTAQRHYTLATNYRSTRAMVAATNHVFAVAEARSGSPGAFLFRQNGENALPFMPVAAQGRTAQWVIDDDPAAALTVWCYDEGEKVGRGEYTRHFAQVTANEIVRLLRLGQQGRAGFRSDDGAFIALAPADIAVLVNSGSEARAVRMAMSAVGVRSVYLSDKESVFDSPMAAQLQRWLAACATPGDDRYLRAALGTAALGLTWAELDGLNADEMAWEARVVQFRGYQESWRRQGVLPMVRRLLNDFAVPRRLLAMGNERDLTDVLHLAELLQQAATLLDGEHALLRYLAEQCAVPASQSDVRKLRLESDAALVRVVTVHKSKGLEYPLVFLPFAAAFREVKASDVPLKWHDAQHHLQVSLRADAHVLEQAAQERLGEDLRKLYVALTRSCFATWMGLAPLADLARSAIGYLLDGGAPVGPGQLAPVLARFAAGADAAPTAWRIQPSTPADVHSDAVFASAEVVLPLLPVRTLVLPPRENWWIASYSALKTHQGRLDDDADIDTAVLVGPDSADTVTAGTVYARDTAGLITAGSVAGMADFPVAAETAGEDIFADSEDRSDQASLAELTGAMGWGAAVPGDGRSLGVLHDFPRGPGPGSFLHSLLEWMGQQGFARVVTAPAALEELIARRCNVRGWERWITPLMTWSQALLTTPLHLPGTRTPQPLGSLTTYRVEMEFMFAVQAVATTVLDAAVCRATLGGVPRPVLVPGRLNGMLKGFIDLIFEHEGRYYVVDYKSNWLGDDDRHYTPAAMRAAILDKRYDLQYVLYIFALHRLLRARVAGYRYAQQMGGAVSLFLRGTQSPTQGLHHECPPESLMDELDQLFAAGGAN